MVGICRALVILQVASHAGCVVERVVVVDVAIGALPRRHGVQPSQRKTSRGVIELSVGPEIRVVALLAGDRKAGVGYWRSRVVVIGLMATDARCDRDVVVVLAVTIATLARWNHMRPSQRESGFRVIEARWLPGGRAVTGLAGLGKSAGDVVWVRGFVVIVQVAGNARIGCQIEVVIDVAVAALARRHGMLACQREVRHRVIERRRRPGDRAVALGAVR